MKSYDFLIIGAGVIGLNIARSLKNRFPSTSILVIEKETALAKHSSGRNSGVLHAGFYYTADSLKAKFTLEGNRRWREFCSLKKIPINECGKLVVTRNESELPGLFELGNRALKNQVPVEILTEVEALKREPRAKTFKQALWSPITATVDPIKCVNVLAEDLIEKGVEIRNGVCFLGRSAGVVKTNQGNISTDYIVNAAGLYADKIAKNFGFAQIFAILPFKGLYLYSSEAPNSFKTHIYPVPNLKNPFLGVHFTLTMDNKVKVGPTAIPAFWREQYNNFENFSSTELLDILFRQLQLLFSANFDFRGLALEEIKKYQKAYMVKQAAQLAMGAERAKYTWGKPGIRAQLLNVKTKQLVMDFHFEGDEKSFHVLNAVSPAFTAAMPFADYLVEQIELKLTKKSPSMPLNPERNA